MSVKSRIAQLNTRLAETLTEKGVQADGSETTTALIGKVAEIEQGGDDGFAWYAKNVTYNNTEKFRVVDAVEILGDAIFERLTYASRLFYNSNVKVIGNLSFPVATDINTLFYNSTKLEEVGVITLGQLCYVRGAFLGCSSLRKFGGFVGRFTSTPEHLFNGCAKLQEIVEPLDFTGTMGGLASVFNNCVELEEVRFVAGSIAQSLINHSPLLSDASVQSTIDGLADLTGGATQTLTLASAVAVSDEQKAAITLKNWTLVQ